MNGYHEVFMIVVLLVVSIFHMEHLHDGESMYSCDGDICQFRTYYSHFLYI